MYSQFFRNGSKTALTWGSVLDFQLVSLTPMNGLSEMTLAPLDRFRPAPIQRFSPHASAARAMPCRSSGDRSRSSTLASSSRFLTSTRWRSVHQRRNSAVRETQGVERHAEAKQDHPENP